MSKIKGKKVLLIGGSGVLGSEYVRSLIKEKTKLSVLDIKSKKFDKLKKKYKKIHSIECDVTDEYELKASINKSLKYLNGIDCLIYNSAATQESFLNHQVKFPKFEKYPLELWNHSIQVNLTGAFLAARECNNLLKKRNGSIIFVSSTYGLVGPDHSIYEKQKFKSIPSYSASKAGIIGLAKWLSTWNKGKVRVNVVTPGGVYNKHNKKFVREYSKRTPMGRMASKNELFGIIKYLISDDSSYANGQNFIIDGGYTSW